jgi:selenocysteine-specific elongation factor
VSAKPLRHGARVRFHHGTAELLGRVAISSVTADRSASAPAGMPGEVQGLAAGDIPPGFGARVRIRLESPAVLTRGDRFILRAYSPPVTIAGGAVLDPHPPRGGIRTEAGRARLARLDPGSRPFDEADVVVSAVGQMLDERAAAGLRVAELVSRAGLTPAGAVATVQRLQSAGRGLLLGEVVVAQAAVASLEHALVARLATYHELEPLSEGMPREEARARLFARAHPAVFEHVIGRLSGRGDLTGRDRLALSTHRVAPSTDETRAMGMIEQAFLDAGLRPPDPTSIATATGLTPGATEQAVRLLQRRRTLIRLDTLWFHAEALARLKEDVAGLRRAGADTRIDVATFKERYGVSRKFAIPLLEYLDRERVTRRVGETRVVL